MFTGIVEILGKVTSIVPLDSSESGGQGFSITIGNAAEILGDCHLGDSIAVNGMFITLDFLYFRIVLVPLPSPFFLFLVTRRRDRLVYQGRPARIACSKRRKENCI
jgi:hypothetical protein